MREFITCNKCGRQITVLPKHLALGEVVCSHSNCKQTNILQSLYSDTILKGMDFFGELVYSKDTNKKYTIKKVINTIGRSADCDIVIERIEHEGKCFISNFHATLIVSFNKLTGLLNYQINDSDGTKLSTNGTFVKNIKLNKNHKLAAGEELYLTENDCIDLGGSDQFDLVKFIIPAKTLETYKGKAFDNRDTEEITQ